MHSLIVSALAILLAGHARGQGGAPAAPTAPVLTVSTPNATVVCEPTLLQWTGGIPPYLAYSILLGNSTGPAIRPFPPQFNPAKPWIVNVEPDTPLTLKVQDVEGEIAFSDVFIAQEGTTTACDGF